MSIIDSFLNVLVPHTCLSCGSEGSLLCLTCQTGLKRVPERCYRCQKISDDSRTCQACRSHSQLQHVWVATAYEGAAKDLVWKLKFGGAQAAARQMVRCMVLPEQLTPDTLIVHVPTATRRVRSRGYDQARLLAKELARQLHQPHLACLARLGQQQQVGASRRQRVTQLASAFQAKQLSALRQARILLVDDVITTGSTLEAAAATLKAAGAKQVDAIVFAQA
jgi:ComF family protein